MGGPDTRPLRVGRGPRRPRIALLQLRVVSSSHRTEYLQLRAEIWTFSGRFILNNTVVCAYPHEKYNIHFTITYVSLRLALPRIRHQPELIDENGTDGWTRYGVAVNIGLEEGKPHVELENGGVVLFLSFRNTLSCLWLTRRKVSWINENFAQKCNNKQEVWFVKAIENDQ